MSKLNMMWIDEQINREFERDNLPEAVRDLAALVTVRNFLGAGETAPAPKQTHATAEHYPEMNRETAEKLVSAMVGSDPAFPTGGRWTIEEVKPFSHKYGFPTAGKGLFDFYVTMNAMYSDYFDVAKKYGVTNPDFFADLARAFIIDKDANPNKVEMYFRHIAKH